MIVDPSLGLLARASRLLSKTRWKRYHNLQRQSVNLREVSKLTQQLKFMLQLCPYKNNYLCCAAGKKLKDGDLPS